MKRTGTGTDRRARHTHGTTYYERDPYREHEFYSLVRAAQHSCFRLERQPEYDHGTGTPPFRHFPTGDRFGGRWLNVVRETTGRGVCMRRLFAVDDPPSSYQRLRIAMARNSEEAGEDVRVLFGPAADATRRANRAAPHDWWVVDDAVVLTFFHARWHIASSATFCTWPDWVHRIREQGDAAWASAVSPTGWGAATGGRA